MLIAAAVLKLTGTNVSAASDLGHLFGPEVRHFLIPNELLLGGWFLSGVGRRAAWLAALMLFACFALVSGYAGWQGASSCGCLGATQVSPWLVCAFDVAAVMALLLTRPRGVWEASDRVAVKLAGTVAVVLVFGSAAAAWQFGSLTVAVGHLFARPIVAVPAEVDLGTCAPGEEVEARVEFANLTDVRIQAIMVRSDCRCLSSPDLPVWIEARERRSILVRVSTPRDEGAFTRKVQWITTAGTVSGRVAGQVASLPPEAPAARSAGE